MRILDSLKIAFPLFVLSVFFTFDANASIDNAGVFDNVLNRYSMAAHSWANVITHAASWLFWTLVVISMVWTFGMMALRKADIGEFFAEFVRFTIFTGFFWWLLINGPQFASSIYMSLQQLASNATGLGHQLSPSGIVDIGFFIFEKVIKQSSLWSPMNSLAGILMAVAILVILSLVGVNMLLLLASGWVLAYGGVFFLGFGGSRWTSDMAINYYKVVLGVAAQLMAMVLLVGIGKTFLDDYYTHMNNKISLSEMGVMLIVVIILLALVNKVPPLISGIITGASIGGAGIGSFGAGAALGASHMASAALSTGGAAIASGAASMVGASSAIMAAFSKASENVSAGTDVLSSFGGSGLIQGGESHTNNTPFAQAAGLTGSSSFGMSSSVGLSSSKGGSKSEGGNFKEKADKGDNFEQQGKSGNADFGFLASTAKAVGTAGRITADAGMNMAKGTAEVAKDKMASIKEAAMERIAETTGGMIATAIRGKENSAAETDIDMPQQSAESADLTFDENSLASADFISVDPESEVAAFRDRDNETLEKKSP
ncbi:MAG: P-type conjugative transfer protein TrbL [Alphaproteobacteria bacterium 41-28]|nr:MAG: P-type conjugative transfer protein TrbL [Alphaproteobacteria bacterium 41-28]